MNSNNASHRKKRKVGVGKKLFAKILPFGDKITNYPPSPPFFLSFSPSFLSGSLFHSVTQMTTHTFKLTHQYSAVSKVPWQSITAMETAQVLCMRGTLAKTSMRLWTLHTQSATSTRHRPRFHPDLIVGRSLRPRPCTKCHCYVTGFVRKNN